MNQNVRNMNLDELLKAAIRDPSMRSMFLQSLMRSDVYVICTKPVRQERDRSEGGIQLELITIQNPDGDMFIPFFTSYRALQQFAKRYVESYKINCLRLFDLIQSMPAVLNAISYNEADTIQYRACEQSMGHITKAASKFLSKQPNVDRAFILEMVRGCEKPQLLIVVDMIGSTRKLFVPLSKYLSRYTRGTESLSFISYEQDMGKKAAAATDPFYVRKKRYFER